MDGPAQGGSPLTQAPGGSASRCLLVALSPRMHLSPCAVSTPLWICGGFPEAVYLHLKQTLETLNSVFCDPTLPPRPQHRQVKAVPSLQVVQVVQVPCVPEPRQRRPSARALTASEQEEEPVTRGTEGRSRATIPPLARRLQ